MKRYLHYTLAATLLLAGSAGSNLAADLQPGGATSMLVEKKTLTLDGARRVIAAAESEAKRLNAPGGVIAVVDNGGNLMALERLDGTFAAGANISIGKARTAVLFQRPTKFFEDVIGKGRTSMVTVSEVTPFTPLQGGIPVMVDGEIVGGVGVSGAASAPQDEQLAIAGSKAFEGMMANAAVTYFESDKVSQAFAKGAVLFNNGTNYMVHASRREGPGMVEVHTKDTDIVHVLEGSATLVTGGEMIDGKATEPDEFRGKSIRGGETRHIAKGDVIIIPNGVPHWFLQVDGPLSYYVVKVR
jgi:glc operon protein GlcG